MTLTLAPPQRKALAKPVALAPVPMSGETQDQFFERASRAMRGIPVNRRTIQILGLWKQSPNDVDLRGKAAQQFPPTKFQHFGPRCVFIEHTVPGNEERDEIVYDRNALLKLVEWQNFRIRNSDNFAAISDGHTPSNEEKSGGAPMPDVLGYSGPFYLGLLGDVEPTWAVYADEWVHTEDLPRFEKLQRRSPEVWVNEPIERRTMDPIAALGAETPRLDSGMNPYSRAGDGAVVMRYSAMAFPGPTNTYIPSAGPRRKSQTKYGATMPFPDASPTPDQQDPASLLGEIIQGLIPTIVQAFQQKMGGDPADQQDDDAGAQDGTDIPRGMDAEPDDGSVPGMGDDQPAPDAMPDATPPAAPAAPPVKEPAVNPGMNPDAEEQKYAAMGPQCHAAYKAGKASSMRYSRSNGDSELHKVVARQQVQLNTMKQNLERERRDVVRYSKLAELSHEYAFDAKDEAETCFDMTDVQFDRHLSHTVAKYAKRDDVTSLEIFDDGEPSRYSGRGEPQVKAEVIEKYSREAASIAAKKNAAKRGSTSFEAEFDALMKQHGVAV